MDSSMISADLLPSALESILFPVIASDFSGLVVYALLIVGGISLVCLAAGYATTVLLLGREFRGKTVVSTLFFAGGWFTVGWFVAEAFYW